MSTLWIIKRLDVVENFGLGLLPRSVVSVMDQFGLESMEEVFNIISLDSDN